MQQSQSIFKKWFPVQLRLPVLIFAIFPHLMLFSIFTMNTTFTASFLDLEVDDLQFLFSLAYAMIVCGMFIHVRFFQFFNVKSYLLCMTILNIVVLFAMTLTTNSQIILILRFIQGPLILFEGVILIPIIIAQINNQQAKLIAFSILYGYMLTGDKFATSIIKFAIENYNHNMIIYTVIAFHGVVLLLYLMVLNHKRLFPKKPLYQLNLVGILLMMVCLISGAFFLVYGKKLYWFESPKLCLSFAMCLVSGALFLGQQIKAKRPLFHFEVFKSRRVILGMFLFFIFYILRSSMSNIYQVMGVIWKWPWYYVLKIQYFNVTGSLIGVFVAYQLMNRNVSFSKIFIIGFSSLAGSMLYFSYLFLPDTKVDVVVPALLLQGFGQGILFCPLVLYMLGSVHPSISGSVSQSGTAVRFWTNTIGFAIMQNAVLHLTTKHQFLMTKNLDVTNTIFQEEWTKLFGKFDATHLTNESISLTVASIQNKLYTQALLVTNIEIFRSLFVLAFIVACLILVYSTMRNRFKISN